MQSLGKAIGDLRAVVPGIEGHLIERRYKPGSVIVDSGMIAGESQLSGDGYNYAAVPLTEVLATFLTAAVLLALTSAFVGIDGVDAGTANDPKKWFFAGLLGGLGTLVRPETPLVLAAAALILAIHWRAPANWRPSWEVVATFLPSGNQVVWSVQEK